MARAKIEPGFPTDQKSALYRLKLMYNKAEKAGIRKYLLWHWQDAMDET